MAIIEIIKKKKNQKEKDLEIEGGDLDVEAKDIYYSIGTGVEDLLSSGLGGSFAFFNKYFPRYSKALTGLCEENENEIKSVLTKFFQIELILASLLTASKPLLRVGMTNSSKYCLVPIFLTSSSVLTIFFSFPF